MKFDLAEDFLTKTTCIRLHSSMNPFMVSKVTRMTLTWTIWTHVKT
jgi:hypothetical protein